MSDIINTILVWLNRLLSLITESVVEQLSFLPAWVANIVIAAPIGFMLMLVYKYTSNQKAIGKIKDAVKADMLALKLFRDSLSITFVTQARLFRGAFLQMLHSLLPVIIMALPVTLILGQLAMWYDYRALLPGDDAVVMMQLNLADGTEFPDIALTENDDFDIVAGPVRVRTKNQMFVRIRVKDYTLKELVFTIGAYENLVKEIAVGGRIRRVISPKRPAWNTIDILTYPAESPFPPDSVVKSIEILYPKRTDWPLGIDSWLVYFIILLFVWALIAKPFLKVKM